MRWGGRRDQRQKIGRVKRPARHSPAKRTLWPFSVSSHDPGMSISRARSLRRNPTDAEKKLWSVLRLQQMDGHRFRRQQPGGASVVDFICLAEKLIIEVDGGQHASQTARDQARTAWLGSNGYRVLRYWNNDVLGNIDGVAETILAALRSGDSSV